MCVSRSSLCLGFDCLCCTFIISFFFFNDTATTEIYTLSLHDALPICCFLRTTVVHFSLFWSTLARWPPFCPRVGPRQGKTDRKSTRLNSSHGYISYAVFCLKKKKSPPHSQFT